MTDFLFEPPGWTCTICGGWWRRERRMCPACFPSEREAAMFGGFGSARVLRMRQQAMDAPKREVSKSEFIRLMMSEGTPRKEAEMNAKISLNMGAHTLVCGELLLIVKGKRRTAGKKTK